MTKNPAPFPGPETRPKPTAPPPYTKVPPSGTDGHPVPSDEVFIPGPVGRHVCVYCDASLVRDKRGRCRNCGGAAPARERPALYPDPPEYTVDPPDYIVK